MGSWHRTFKKTIVLDIIAWLFFFVFIFIFTLHFCQMTLIFPCISKRKMGFLACWKVTHKYLMRHLWLLPECSSSEWRYVLMESEFDSTTKYIPISMSVYLSLISRFWSSPLQPLLPLSEPPSSLISIK